VAFVDAVAVGMADVLAADGFVAAVLAAAAGAVTRRARAPAATIRDRRARGRGTGMGGSIHQRINYAE